MPVQNEKGSTMCENAAMFPLSLSGRIKVYFCANVCSTLGLETRPHETLDIPLDRRYYYIENKSGFGINFSLLIKFFSPEERNDGRKTDI
jgi:hypothetical protein